MPATHLCRFSCLISSRLSVQFVYFSRCFVQETRAWKRLQAAHQNSFVRILPARAMEVVQEVVGTLRVCKSGDKLQRKHTRKCNLRASRCNEDTESLLLSDEIQTQIDTSYLSSHTASMHTRMHIIFMGILSCTRQRRHSTNKTACKPLGLASMRTCCTIARPCGFVYAHICVLSYYNIMVIGSRVLRATDTTTHAHMHTRAGARRERMRTASKVLLSSRKPDKLEFRRQRSRVKTHTARTERT